MLGCPGPDGTRFQVPAAPRRRHPCAAASSHADVLQLHRVVVWRTLRDCNRPACRRWRPALPAPETHRAALREAPRLRPRRSPAVRTAPREGAQVDGRPRCAATETAAGNAHTRVFRVGTRCRCFGVNARRCEGGRGVVCVQALKRPPRRLPGVASPSASAPRGQRFPASSPTLGATWPLRPGPSGARAGASRRGVFAPQTTVNTEAGVRLPPANAARGDASLCHLSPLCRLP